MHIPDNFLSTPVWATLDAVSLPAVALVSRKAKSATEADRLPLLGVMGAFVFAAQMVNFPVGIGTSGHIVGGTLLACLLGPWAAALVVTAILVIQALVFQDGGVLALGANVLNMALLGVLVGYAPVSLLFRTRWRNAAIFGGAACSVLVSGTCALSELLISGVRMPLTLIGISLCLFSVNALVEGAITLSVLKAVERLGLTTFLADEGQRRRDAAASLPRWKTAVPVIASCAFLLAMCGVFLASLLPDGLEHLAKALQIPFGAHPLFQAPLRDYRVPALGANWLSRASAGIFGLLAIYCVCAIGSALLGRARRSFS
jgi:cobalt/nickel transport system permease protein